MVNTLSQSDMSNFLLGAISCLWLLHFGACDEECTQSVVATRDTFYVPAGGSLSLSCVVRHCRDKWKGNWMWSNSSHNLILVKESVKHHFTQVTLSASDTQMTLNLVNVNQSDEGFYGYKAVWGESDIDQGHLSYVNITAAVPTRRRVLHRILVCASAFLCLPIILGLARCLSSEVKPQTLPRTLSTHVAVYKDQPHPAPQPLPRCPVPKKRGISSHKGPPKSQKTSEKAEVVYADISQSSLRQQGATREPPQSTVYSSVRFS